MIEELTQQKLLLDLQVEELQTRVHSLSSSKRREGEVEVSLVQGGFTFSDLMMSPGLLTVGRIRPRSPLWLAAVLLTSSVLMWTCFYLNRLFTPTLQMFDSQWRRLLGLDRPNSLLG